MPLKNPWLAVMLLVVPFLSGCASRRTQSVRPASQGEAIRAGAGPGEKVSAYDFNHDGKPDVWTVTVAEAQADGTTQSRLVRKELDINWDGKVDIRRTYASGEQLQLESLDLDFDGRVDQTNSYDKNVLVKKERDLNYDGRPDEWVFFENGQRVRKERDSNGDGRVDYWEYWEKDAVDRIGEDLDGDGKVDRWTKAAEESRGQP
jgi:hypothetical protein